MVPNALVSIIIPSYNYGHYIIETLNSVRAQKYQYWEAIVIDDGSTDNTEALVSALAKIDARIRYVYQVNKGLSEARNTGLMYSSGQYVQFLDADDLISEDKLELQLKHFASDPSLGISYTDAYYFRSANTQEKFKTLNLTQEELKTKLSDNTFFEQIYKLIVQNIMPVNSPLVKKEVIERIGSFSTNLSSLEDWEFWFRSAMCSKFGYLGNSKAYCLVRVHPNSMSKNSRRMILNELILRKLFENYIANSVFNATERKKINKQNGKLLKRQYSYFIAEEGFFNLRSAAQIIKRDGWKMFFLGYVKALNDLRKKVSS
jgi:glycosyltransferase involved in cell wall biosynthesis